MNYYQDQNTGYQQKVVSGYLQQQMQIQQGFSRQNYYNYEIQDHLDVYFRLFGKNDLDIIYLYFLSNKKQNDITEILQKTQPAISYDVTRIKQQIQFVIRIVQKQDQFIIFITDEQLKLNLSERQLLLVFFYSTSIVKTSKILNQNQITCRTRIRKAIQKLSYYGYNQMYEFFCYVLQNLNKIKKQII